MICLRYFQTAKSKFEKLTICYWVMDSNTWSPKHESLPMTTRPLVKNFTVGLQNKINSLQKYFTSEPWTRYDTQAKKYRITNTEQEIYALRRNNTKMFQKRPFMVSFSLFCLFYNQIKASKCSITVGDDCIKTRVLGYWKRPRCQLCHNCCP